MQNRISLSRFVRQVVWVSGLLVLTCGLHTQVEAQWLRNPSEDLKGPYVDSDPFDLIVLNDAGDNAIMKVQPFGDKLPGDFSEDGMLQFSFFDDPEGETYEVPYSSISKVQTFNQLLTEEADEWLSNQEYAKAFRNYLFIYDHGGRNDSQLVQSLNKCLFEDGKKSFQSREFELALSIYEDIYQKDPGYRVEGLNLTLAQIVMSCYDGIIQKQFDDEDYIEVRNTLASVTAKYEKESSVLSKKWSNAFKKRSDDLLADAKRLASEGKGREAHLAAKQAEQMYPNRPETFELQKALLVQFPLVVVGVNQPAADASPNRLEHWGSRRVGRLTQRTMVELNGLTDEGGKYEFLNGTMYRADEVGMKYTLELKDDVSEFAVPTVNAFEVSSRLLSVAEESSPSYNVAWQKIVEEVQIEDENKVSFTLRTPYVRPEALLNVAYKNINEAGQPDQNGAYVMMAMDKQSATFELNPRYDRRPNQQHPVIIEEFYKASSTAVDDLIKGNIDIVDRIPVADIARLKASKDVQVRPYILPTVHMLVPKIRGEMKNDPNFRNGLSHAIDRTLLVKDVICGGQEIEGCEVVSGPFPIGTEENDQISYGYDLKVKPLPFNSQLGMVLIQLALRANPPIRPEPIPMPKLVLAHPDSSTATNAAEAIARMWNEIGVTTSTLKLAPDQTVPDNDDWDFLYVESTIEEPLADAQKLIGPAGFAKDVSAPIEQTLRNLSYSESWQGTCRTLRRLHRQVAVDLSIIPLWQVKEHYAYRTSVRNIGRDLIHLYQNVDRWKIDLESEEEEK